MELIKIESNVIGNGAVNSVNSRDIHSSLWVKTPYSMWIQRAIEKYGFEENTDFTINKFVNGKATQSDYIVTLDMAKELCMLDDSEMGKSYRRYFIEKEKEAKQLRIPTDPMEILSLVFDAQKATNIELIEIKTEIEELKGDIVLTPSQKRILQKSVATKVYSFIADFDDFYVQNHKAKLFSKIYSKLKDRFAVSSYMEIPRLSFNEAKSMVDNITLIDLV